MTLQDFEQAKGPRIIGPVVVCEGKLAGSRLQANEGSAVDLRCRPHGLKAGPCREASSAEATEDIGDHIPIVSRQIVIGVEEPELECPHLSR